MKERRKPTPFGKRVRMRLIELDMRQKDLASLLGVSDAFLTYLLYGDRPLGTWEKRICDALNLGKAENPPPGL